MLKYLLWITVLIAVAVWAHAFFSHTEDTALDAAAKLGDSFAPLAFLALVLSLQTQQAELTVAREEKRESRKALAQQIKALSQARQQDWLRTITSAYANWLGAYQALLEAQHSEHLRQRLVLQALVTRMDNRDPPADDEMGEGMEIPLVVAQNLHALRARMVQGLHMIQLQETNTQLATIVAELSDVPEHSQPPLWNAWSVAVVSSQIEELEKRLLEVAARQDDRAIPELVASVRRIHSPTALAPESNEPPRNQ